MTKVAIFDLDGVMNSISDVRAHLVPANADRADHWAEWHKAHVKEKVNPAMVSMIHALCADGWRIVFVSNRINYCMDSTMRQLDDIDFAVVCLRHPLDHTPTREYKVETVARIIIAGDIAGADTQYLVFDDDQDVINDLNDLAFDNLIALCVQTFTG